MIETSNDRGTWEVFTRTMWVRPDGTVHFNKPHGVVLVYSIEEARAKCAAYNRTRQRHDGGDGGWTSRKAEFRRIA